MALSTPFLYFYKRALLLLFVLSYIVNGDISTQDHNNLNPPTPRHISSAVLSSTSTSVKETLAVDISLRTLLAKKKAKKRKIEKKIKRKSPRPTNTKKSPPSVPSPTTPTSNISYSTAGYEVKVLQLTNVERAKHGLTPLQWDALLAKAARTHSTNMIAHDFFGHTGADGFDFYDRMIAAGFTVGMSWTGGENVAAGYLTPGAVVEGWMNSPGHRANILNSAYTRLGVGHRGIGVDPGKVTYNVYWTQVFYGGN